MLHKALSCCYEECTWICAKEHGLFSLFFCLVHVVQKIVLHGEEGSRCSRGDADLIVDMFDVVLNGALRDRKSFRHLAIGMPASD